jgi:hypothetical protein
MESVLLESFSHRAMLSALWPSTSACAAAMPRPCISVRSGGLLRLLHAKAVTSMMDNSDGQSLSHSDLNMIENDFIMNSIYYKG